MNLRSFANLFDIMPKINIGQSCTNKHPASMVKLQPVEMLITGPNSIKFFIHNGEEKEYFRSHRSISGIRFNGSGFDIKLESFYEETKPVTLIDFLYCISNGIGGKSQRITIGNYDITFAISANGEIPKFFKRHPEYLERTIKTIQYDEEMDSICIYLEYEFSEIIQSMINGL